MSKKTPNDAIEGLHEQRVQAAAAFATPAHPLSMLLTEIARDVARASNEPLELFPVCHHSPASGVHLLRRLREKTYRVIFVEMCEDLERVVPNLESCRFPVALQAFSSGGTRFPEEWSPLNVVAPLTELSAEYQAIAFALENPETKLVFVDRAADYVFQWMPQEKDALEARVVTDEDDDDGPTAAPAETKARASHGSAVGVQVGSLVPTFDEFLAFLLKNARVKHFAEWFDQYVEACVIGADYETYRQVLFMVGSLIRRLGRKETDLTEDRLRERYMWTRMKQYLAEHGIAPSDAIHVCGAAHTASDVDEFGVESAVVWDIPKKSDAAWLYGIIPSSYLAIEHQFGNPSGTLRLAEQHWQKALRALKLPPLKITKKEDGEADESGTPKAKGKKKTAKSIAATPKSEHAAAFVAETVTTDPLLGFLTRPPELREGDEEELLRWCVDITTLARDNGYLASTADSIAIYQTSMLLAGMRNRAHPSPYDFTDAAITCLEKNRTPKKRDIARLCQILLGGDRVGRVGYASLPPLAQNVYDRLARLEGKSFKLESSIIQRALLDLKSRPELLPCSDVLWMLSYLSPALCRPIMGERKLGTKPVQESWDVTVGKHQGLLITLGYEGVSIESVLEKRLKAKAYGSTTTTASALAAVEDAILYLKSPRLTGELGERSIELLTQSTGASEAPEVFERVRRLVHHYRSTPTGLPDWLKRFVTTGYSHYATLLPASFADDATSAEQVAGMLSFLFTLESLALAFGCERSQMIIAVKQSSAGAEGPTKLGLLWSAEWLLGLRDLSEIRGFLDSVLHNVMMLPAFPDYVAGFLLSLRFSSLMGRLVVELLSKAFSALPDDVLLPWLPSLLMALRPHAAELMPTLLKEAGHVFPRSLDALATWTPPWEMPADPDAAESEPDHAPSSSADRTPEEAAVHTLLREHRVTTDSLAWLLGESGRWSSAEPTHTEPKDAAAVAKSPTPSAVGNLLAEYPVALESLARLLG